MGSKFPTPPPTGNHNQWENIPLPPPPPPKRYGRGDIVGGLVVCYRCLRPRHRHETNPCIKCICELRVEADQAIAAAKTPPEYVI